MLNYNKNRLINQCLQKYYESFAQTLDTAQTMYQRVITKRYSAISFTIYKRALRKWIRRIGGIKGN